MNGNHDIARPSRGAMTRRSEDRSPRLDTRGPRLPRRGRVRVLRTRAMKRMGARRPLL